MPILFMDSEETQWQTHTSVHDNAMIRDTHGIYMDKVMHGRMVLSGVNAVLYSLVMEIESSGRFSEKYYQREAFAGTVQDCFIPKMEKIFQNRLVRLEEIARKDVVIV